MNEPGLDTEAGMIDREKTPTYHEFPAASTIVTTSVINPSEQVMLKNISSFWQSIFLKTNVTGWWSSSTYIPHICHGQISHEHMGNLVTICGEDFKPSDDFFIPVVHRVVLKEPGSLQDGQQHG